MKLHDPAHLQKQLQFTHPDYVMFVPSEWDYESDNVHLYVVHHEPSDRLLAFWTQSSVENNGNNHIVMAESADGGTTWTKPRFLLGSRCKEGGEDKQASWAIPVISRSGKVYLFYYQEVEYHDFNRQIGALFSCITSEDGGATWSEPAPVAQRKTPFDPTEGDTQNNLIFQLPLRGPDGYYYAGYTKWTSEQCKIEKKGSTRLYFMRFDNIDEDPAPEKLRFTFLPDRERGIELLKNGKSLAEEPAWVFLPDGRLFCSMRTAQGSVHYALSSDGGHTFTEPRPLLFDDGTPFVHCISPCPIFELADGRYLQLYHGGFHPEKPYTPRNPLRRAIGTFAPNDFQPIRFAKADDAEWMTLPADADPFPGVVELAIYGSVTRRKGKTILWYPDRKFFLLGKNLEF